MSQLPHVTPTLPLITHPSTTEIDTTRSPAAVAAVHRPGTLMSPDPRLIVDTPAIPAPVCHGQINASNYRQGRT
jgi:hypothetical protein